MAKAAVNQFGLQRTGTGYLARLLEANYDVNVLINTGGWKHGLCRTSEMDCIVTTKHPLSWLVSFYKYLNGAMQMKGSFADFVKLGIPMQLWNFAYYHWLRAREEIEPHKMVFVRYEELIRDPAATAGGIAESLGLSRKVGDFVDITQYVDRHKLSKNNFDKSYYLEGKFMAEYSPELLKRVYQMVDRTVLAALGYSEQAPCWKD